MGVKRPFEEEFPELSLKQHKQFDQDNKIILCEEDFPSAFTSPNNDSFVEANSGHYKLQHDGRLYGSHTNAAPVNDKELETSAPLSWVTSSSSEEDTGLEDATFGSYFQTYFDFSMPLHFPEHLENPYFSLINCSSRKEIPVGLDRQAEVLPWGVNVIDSLQYFNSGNLPQQKPMGTCTVPVPDDSSFESSLFISVSKEVPVGPDHQAEVLPWNRNLLRKDCLGSDVREQRLMGTCVTPMPDGSNVSFVKVGQGRTDCCCPDVGSIRCVRQHVKEARETFREAIGEESFSELGFYDMGEEAASKWNANEEHLFHEIIFSNPISRGRNFWNHLSAAFPTRTRNEIISYYFNVFMLRKRATQNRSLLLEIDSDDDEWRGAHEGDLYENRSHSMNPDTDDDDDDDDDDHGADDEQVGVYRELCQVGGARDDSTIEWFGNQDLRLSCGQSTSSETENVCADDGLIQYDGTSSGNGHVDK